MATPEEVYKTASAAAISSGEHEVAIFIKQNIRNLALLYPGLKVPDTSELDTLNAKPAEQRTETENKKFEELQKAEEEYYTTKAKELIDNRQIKFEGVQEAITIANLDSKDDIKNIVAEHKVASLDQLVPTRDQLNAVGKSVGSAAQENTGSIGFLGGATFMAALGGFFKWLLSGFSGGFDGLKKDIAEITASNMKDAVKQHLIELRNANHDMAPILTDNAIIAAGSQTEKTALDFANNANPPPNHFLAGVQPVTFKQQEFHDKIYTGILEPKGKPNLAATIETEYSKTVEDAKNTAGYLGKVASYVPDFMASRLPDAVAKYLPPTAEQIRTTAKAMAPIIARTVAKTVSDPNYRTAGGKSLSALEDNDYAIALKSEVRKALVNHEKDFGLTAPLSDKTGKKNKDGTDQTNLDVWTDSIGDELAKPDNIKLLKSVSTETSRQALQLAVAKAGDKKIDGVKYNQGGKETNRDAGAPTVSASASPETPGRSP